VGRETEIIEMPELTVTLDNKETQKLFQRLKERSHNLSPVMKVIGETILTSIQRNFEVGGRPKKWQSLAKATIREREKIKKWPGQILVRKGISGGLLGSISYKALSDRVLVSATKKYAAIHQFGGKAGRGLKVIIPARPYLMIQDEDIVEIKEIVRDHVMKS
jgi:phage virion morphogenesis protein